MRILFLLSAFVCFGYITPDCSSLPRQFNSYAEAISKVKQTKFKIAENLNTSKSSWIVGAKYYSCDGLTGYMILRTSEREYIHQGLPIGMWTEFKTADSFGKYYNTNIKGHYRLRLTNE